MFGREKTNMRSLIDKRLLINDEIGIIGIYGHDNSRTIYLESSEEAKKSIIRYQINFPKGSFGSDAANGWKINLLPNTFETAREIEEIRI